MLRSVIRKQEVGCAQVAFSLQRTTFVLVKSSNKHYIQLVLKRNKDMYPTTTKQHYSNTAYLVCDNVKDNPHYTALLSTFKHLSKSAYDAFAI